MLAPRLARPEVVAALGAAWRADGNVRASPALREVEAARFGEALRGHQHVPFFHVHATRGFQLWRSTWEPGEGCDHPLCALGRWLAGDGRRWAEAVTGLALAPAPDPTLTSDRYAKATFYDAYDDADADGRAVAFMLHLVPASWPAEWGGHMETLDAAGRVQARWAPTWNTLDLFDVSAPGAWRRLPIVRHHLEGFTVSGHWHHAP